MPTGIYNAVYAPDPVEKVAYIGYLVLALVVFGIYRNGKKMVPWIIGAVIFLWLSLGPQFGLYAIYHAIPGISVIREPGRFDLIASLFIAILAAFGAKALFEHLTSNNKQQNSRVITYVVLIAILGIMFVESNGLHVGSSVNEVTTIQVPQLYYALGNLTGNFQFLDFQHFQ